jgi:heat shock protein HslJ
MPDGTSYTVPSAVTPTSPRGDAASGSAGCNSFNAIATIDDDSITFSQVQTTKMACQDPLATFVAAYMQSLNLASSYTVSESELVMTGPGGRPSLTFVRGS